VVAGHSIRRHALISAPTGSGKTLAAFLASLDALFRQGAEDHLPDETQVVYVSPLKALSNDIRKNLQEPLSGIRALLGEANGTTSMFAPKCAPAIRLRHNARR
jgi:Lhr-like helicase